MQKKYLRVTMPDGSKWDVPVMVIAKSRAEYYSHYDKCSFQEAFKETLNFFETDEPEIIDWAANNMDWEDVEDFARRVVSGEEPDYQEGWVNGAKEIVTREEA